jgi:putative membrane protein
VSAAQIWAAATGVVLLWSGIAPHDRITWWLEVSPVLLGAPLLLATARRFPLTPLLYGLLFAHAVILMVGGHYTYARVPFGFWMQDVLPAILAREILLRRTPLVPGGWLFLLVLSVCLAFSALYEMLEWWTALLGGIAATDFLGTQGDVWDTQWDMFLAGVGATAALLLLSRLHDRQLARFAAAR